MVNVSGHDAPDVEGYCSSLHGDISMRLHRVAVWAVHLIVQVFCLAV